ncbi:MAG TPA: hypothetical protein VHA75_05060, partial [Rugosimonospora sp.]|nr:hypothetical protein [Rugosimonospora sp.]
MDPAPGAHTASGSSASRTTASGGTTTSTTTDTAPAPDHPATATARPGAHVARRTGRGTRNLKWFGLAAWLVLAAL